MVFVVYDAEMDTIINDVKILLQNFDRDGDPEPLAKIADIFEQMAPDIAEHKDILQLRVIIDFNLQRWARSRDSLIKLVRKTPTDPNQFRDLANLNFRLGEFTAVIDSLREYFRLTSDASETRPYHAMSVVLHAVGRGDEAIDFLDDAVRRLPALAIYRDENFPERQQAALDRTLPPVFLNTLFKSASMYIATRLEVGLNLPRCYMTQAVLSGDRIIPSWLDLFAKGGDRLPGAFAGPAGYFGCPDRGWN
jgi:tetratricopeptide (TPR) repeat protein